jgi:hypothetical protein
MAKTQTKVTIELLQKFQQNIKEQADRFKSVRQSMDQSLNGFLWDDPNKYRFEARYNEGLEPLNTKLLPALEQYQQYLAKQIELTLNVQED